MPPSMWVKNPEDLHRAFHKCDQLTQTRYLEASVMVGLLPIQNQAIVNAPKVSRNLARSIHSEIMESRPKYCEGATGTNLDYARRVELGFVGVDALGRQYNQAAQPYLRPAFDEKKQEAVKDMGENLNDILMQLVR